MFRNIVCRLFTSDSGRHVIKEKLSKAYEPFLSKSVLAFAQKEAVPVVGLDRLTRVPFTAGGKIDSPSLDQLNRYESPQALEFMVKVLEDTVVELADVLEKRSNDRAWIDLATSQLAERKAVVMAPANPAPDYAPDDAATAAVVDSCIGLSDMTGRVPFGPSRGSAADPADFLESVGPPVAPLPLCIQGPHVTLFGPADSTEMCLTASNALVSNQKLLPGEPPLVDQLINGSRSALPVRFSHKWGADSEDSLTPIHRDLVTASFNLEQCVRGKIPGLVAAHDRPTAIKRIPGLALPSVAHFLDGAPVPLHVLDFTLTLFNVWDRSADGSTCFYVPKLESEEEAAYIRSLVAAAERRLHELESTFKEGSVRLLVVVENARAIFRVNEIASALYPYFAGASLGWHDYLASTARLLRRDPEFRIPSKSKPSVVISHIRESHELVARVVGRRGGLAIGGMYGVIAAERELTSPSMQTVLAAYLKDVLVQLRRGLVGFWVAAPEFVRVGVALVQAFKKDEMNRQLQVESDAAADNSTDAAASGDAHSNHTNVTRLIQCLIVDQSLQRSLLEFLNAPDPAARLDPSNPLYTRSLLAAELGRVAGDVNRTDDAIRLNVSQSLQYLAEWLCGNACVALPTLVDGVSVRVLDDLATLERSRWEIHLELVHGRVDLDRVLAIVCEQYHFLFVVTGRSDVAVDSPNSGARKWFHVARNLLIRLLTDSEPVEFVTELLTPFLIDSVRRADDPWAVVQQVDPVKFALDRYHVAFVHAWAVSGSDVLAAAVARSAPFARAAAARSASDQYMKPADRAAAARLVHPCSSIDQWTRRVHDAYPLDTDLLSLKAVCDRWNIAGLTVATLWPAMPGRIDDISMHAAAFFSNSHDHRVGTNSLVQIASLSKTVGAAFAIDFLKSHGIGLETPVNQLLAKYSSTFSVVNSDPRADWADRLMLVHLMSNSALGLHYVNGFPASDGLPPALDLLMGERHINKGYIKMTLTREPGTQFGLVGGRPVVELMSPWIDQLGLTGQLMFPVQQAMDSSSCHVARGVNDEGKTVESLIFPSLSAGLLATPVAVAELMRHLTVAYHEPGGCGPVSHAAARLMLHPQQAVSQQAHEFMHADMGLGVFIAKCGQNRIALHQAANEGYRGMYAVCFSGPDTGKGFVATALADNRGVFALADVGRQLLQQFHVDGLQLDRLPGLDSSGFSASALPQETIVNQGLKRLLFAAFVANADDLAAVRDDRWLRDEASGGLRVHARTQDDVCRGARLLWCSDDRFAPATNLVRQSTPRFDPSAFGKSGKTMDSWESARHCPSLTGDESVFRLQDRLLARQSDDDFRPALLSHHIAPYTAADLCLINDAGVGAAATTTTDAPVIREVEVSTVWHDGNHAKHVRIESCELDIDPLTGRLPDDQHWVELVSGPLQGHAVHLAAVPGRLHGRRTRLLRVRMAPDGGLTRVRCYDSPTITGGRGDGGDNGWVSVTRHSEPIPPLDAGAATNRSIECVVKPPTADQIDANWSRVRSPSTVDVACAEFGGRVLAASNEHYGPATSLTSPIQPRGMFDGFESARAHNPAAQQWVELQLGRPTRVRRVVLDMKYFVNNNPERVSVWGRDSTAVVDKEWIPVCVNKDNPFTDGLYVKPFAASSVQFTSQCDKILDQLKIIVTPCGGINRVHVYGDWN